MGKIFYLSYLQMVILLPRTEREFRGPVWLPPKERRVSASMMAADMLIIQPHTKDRQLHSSKAGGHLPITLKAMTVSSIRNFYRTRPGVTPGEAAWKPDTVLHH